MQLPDDDSPRMELVEKRARLEHGPVNRIHLESRLALSRKTV